jgi:septal ring factor EnvC (AmiA/AmiB activator)
LRELNAERTRLLNERGAEIEERQRQVEELPIQRRRLNQAIADLQALSR